MVQCWNMVPKNITRYIAGNEKNNTSESTHVISHRLQNIHHTKTGEPQRQDEA